MSSQRKAHCQGHHRYELKKHEQELDIAQKEHDAVKAKLAALEKKIIVGGENLVKIFLLCHLVFVSYQMLRFSEHNVNTL